MSAYEELFTRFGAPVDAAEIKISAYLSRPDTLSTVESVEYYDKNAARIIAECEAMTEDMRRYRQKLTARYNSLATMNYKRVIKLQRYVNFNNAITYFIRFSTVYEDGTKEETATERYPGKERHKALARFAELKKQYPGAEFDAWMEDEDPAANPRKHITAPVKGVKI